MLISRAFAVVSLGEGLDFYFMQCLDTGGLGFSIYNDQFFPSKEWLNLQNIYQDESSLLENFVRDIKLLEGNKGAYRHIATKAKSMVDGVYSFDKYIDNLKRFYEGDYDFTVQ